MNKRVETELFKKKYQNKCPHLCRKQMINFMIDCLHLLFPQMGNTHYKNQEELEQKISSLKEDLKFIYKCLSKEIESPAEICFSSIDEFFESLLDIEEVLAADANFMADEDPASKGVNEVIICYPGFFAICIHRIAHFFYQKQIPLFPRILSEYAHERTGIDIHPGAKIASPFFIDHGTGIVIGETTQIGKFCKIYQGVTLGALSVEKNLSGVKRHPTIEDHCLLYANATILGGETVIGRNSVIGGNVWITKSIPENSQAYRKQGFEIRPKDV